MKTRTASYLASLALAFAFTLPAHAAPPSMSNFTDAQELGLFRESADLRQLVALSKEEMKDTEGAVSPIIVGAALGALVNGGTYMVGVARDKYPYSTGALVANMTSGALIGATTGGLGAAAGGGLTAGANVWRANGAFANFGANQYLRSSECRLNQKLRC
ncbi:hypothetical protein ACOTEO_11880 [Achromobacter xylosoxidans]|uniref:hypothetical protein n=1 Tax=Achromobacter TaxID=222 RepID=UPI0010412C86|nr:MULTISPECIES: hypothetical protein [Achromobacter]MDH0518684.1 hypothetical protein [Achromobacter xylosoxidans]MDH0543198.1 hypothetical protein [Achromobacter xylosoxidans]NYS14827.1 hypothetical protein [Achromobacter xylosoxidans]QKQ54069.1 hypothetical protein FOC83_14455 [Achromobacter xylosoxidans]QPR96787.1 hypothetical protein I6G72_09575 [Achromobacter xylosoxidans]